MAHPGRGVRHLRLNCAGAPPEWHLRVLEDRQATADAADGIPWVEFKTRWQDRL